MSTLSTDHHPTLRHADREAIGIELQAVLAVLTDLALTGKHAHWNVQGPNFRALHLHLDELVEQWRDAGDAVAERAVALGRAPDGRAHTIAVQTPLPDLDAGPQLDRELLCRPHPHPHRSDRRHPRTHGPPRRRRHRRRRPPARGRGQLEEQAWMIRVQTA